MLVMLQDILNKLGTEPGRFELIDHEHIHDKQTGLKFHLYDTKPFKITMFETPDTTLASMRDFKEDEQLLFQKMKEYLVRIVTETHRNAFREKMNTTS